MIKSITVTNHLNESIELVLTRPDLSGFSVLSVEGLGPVVATINTTELATGDGGVFNSAKLSQRNITMDLLFEDIYESVEDIRLKSYKYFPVKKKITLLVETDRRLASIEGYVESNEPTMFSSRCGCQISIICPNPLFTDAKGRQVTSFSVLEPLFEFPFGISSDGVEMGNLIKETVKIIPYDGDADAGMTIHITAVDTASGIILDNLSTGGSMRINTIMSAGDEIVITTSKGKKSIIRIRNGIKTNILNLMSRNVEWFTLSKGDNIFKYSANSGVNNIDVTIENDVLYSGV
mgnify:CR=1 FL=1